MAYPQRHQVKFDLSARQLLHVEPVVKLLATHYIVPRDTPGQFRVCLSIRILQFKSLKLRVGMVACPRFGSNEIKLLKLGQRFNLSARRGIRQLPLASPACKSNRLL